MVNGNEKTRRGEERSGTREYEERRDGGWTGMMRMRGKERRRTGQDIRTGIYVLERWVGMTGLQGQKRYGTRHQEGGEYMTGMTRIQEER